MQQFVVAALIGLIGGIASGLLGVGGGVVMVPAMIFLLGFSQSPKVAVGTSLAVIIPTAIMGVWKHQQLDQINWKIAALLMPGAVFGSYVGVWLTTQISNAGLKRAFGGLLVIMGFKLLFLK